MKQTNEKNIKFYGLNISNEQDFNKILKEDKIVFLVRHTNAIEKDNEDNNTTYLDYTSKIQKTETTLSKAKEIYDSILDANADNPPYDEYSIIVIYWKNSKEIIPRDYFNYDLKAQKESERLEREYYEQQVQETEQETEQEQQAD